VLCHPQRLLLLLLLLWVLYCRVALAAAAGQQLQPAGSTV
jgi:hypothetical protein